MLVLRRGRATEWERIRTPEACHGRSSSVPGEREPREPVDPKQWTWGPGDLAGPGCSPPTPSTSWRQLGDHRAATLLVGPGPSPEWGGRGGTEHIPSGKGDLFYGLSLCINGFYWLQWLPQ